MVVAAYGAAMQRGAVEWGVCSVDLSRCSRVWGEEERLLFCSRCKMQGMMIIAAQVCGNVTICPRAHVMRGETGGVGAGACNCASGVQRHVFRQQGHRLTCCLRSTASDLAVWHQEEVVVPAQLHRLLALAQFEQLLLCPPCGCVCGLGSDGGGMVAIKPMNIRHGCRLESEWVCLL